MCFITLSLMYNAISVCFNPFSSVVVIGFEQVRYAVNESDVQVVIAVTVRNGQLSRPVVVTVVTMETSALGKTQFF